MAIVVVCVIFGITELTHIVGELDAADAVFDAAPVIVISTIWTQPTLSVTVTVYMPGAKPANELTPALLLLV